MRTRRVLQVHRDFAPDRGGGGVARHIHGLATVASGQGFTVRVVAPDALRPRDDCPYDVEPCGTLGLWHHIGWADAVHVHGARNPIAVVAALLAHLRGKRIVYTPHCYYQDGSRLKRAAKKLWDRTIERLLLRSSDAVVLLAPFWLDWLVAQGLVVTAPVILPNCVLDASLLARPLAASPIEGSPSLLCLGRLDPVKRLGDAIELLGRPGFEAAVLHIVGTGPDRAHLEAVARHVGVAGRVRFHGFLPDADVASMAAAIDCFLMPSAMEGGATVLIEMMLMGCRVVASDIPGNRAILAAVGEEAGLYPLGDVVALGTTLREVLVRPVNTETATHVRAVFTWEPRAREVAALYRTRDQAPQSRAATS